MTGESVKEALRRPLHQAGPVSRAALDLGLSDLLDLAEYVRRLPYARPDDRDPPTAVLVEGRGTCSDKHRLIATAARECAHRGVELMVGIYMMGPANTPAVGQVLRAAGADAIPEAHCYLRVTGDRLDFTGLPGAAASPFDALLSEHTVPPETLAFTKRQLHENAMADWAGRHGMAFDHAWALREACIEALAGS